MSAAVGGFFWLPGYLNVGSWAPPWEIKNLKTLHRKYKMNKIT